jgi:hypothetical protein
MMDKVFMIGALFGGAGGKGRRGMQDVATAEGQ